MNRLRIVFVKGSLAVVLAVGLAGLVYAQSEGTRSAETSAAGRRPFQARVIVTPQGNGFETVFLPIPAGKRLVIENVSAIARTAPGQRMEMNYFTYYDNNGNGDTGSGIEDVTFHRVALTEQGTFGEMAIASANHKVLVFADEQIGSARYQVGVQARLNEYPAVGSPQAQFTLSGYVEDLPVR